MPQFLITALLAFAILAPAHAASSENLCEGLFTGKERVNFPAVAKPPFMKYYKEPAFGTKVIRISESYSGEVIKPSYSSMQAWNADESLMLLYHSGENGGHVLYDGKTYEFFRKLDIVPNDFEEVYWSHTNPDTLYYVSEYSSDFGVFYRYSVKKDRSIKIRDFTDVCGIDGMATGGGDVQMQSLDDDLFGFRCQNENEIATMFTYRISTDEVVSVPMSEDKGWNRWSAPLPGPSGKQLWLQGKVLELDLTSVKFEHDMANHGEHANIGLTHDGQDAVFQAVFDPSPKGCNDDLWQGVGHLVIHNMETGECRSVINEAKGYPYTTSGTHISAQAYKKPGWILLSSVGYDDFDYFTNGRRPPVFFSEIYLANTDPDNEVVCRLAHHRSFGKSAQLGQYNSYFGEPHATISPTGTRIVFGSDWYDSGSVDTYVIELPAYKR